MNRFKHFLIETILRFTPTVPHIPLIGKRQKDGSIQYFKNDEERRNHIIQMMQAPDEHLSGVHLRAFHLVSDMVAKNEMPKQFEIPAKVFIVGGNMHKDAVGLMDDAKGILHNVQTPTTFMAHIRKHMNDYQEQRGIPEDQRLTLGRVTSRRDSNKDDVFPGGLSRSGFMKHPWIRQDTLTMQSSEYHDKHVTPHTGQRWIELTRPEREVYDQGHIHARKIAKSDLENQ